MSTHRVVQQPDGRIIAEGTRQFCEGYAAALLTHTISDLHRTALSELYRVTAVDPQTEGRQQDALEAVQLIVHHVPDCNCSIDPQCVP